MEIFVPLLMCAMFLAAMLGLMRFSLYLSNVFALRSVYKSGVYTAKTVHTLFLARFGIKRIFSNIFLPRKAEYGTVYDPYDHLLLLNGAVVMITVCREDGRIHNPTLGESWHNRVRTRFGEEREYIFENPIAAGILKKDALKKLFENAKIHVSVPIEHIVIFPSRRISFSSPRQKEIMSPPEAMRTLERLHKTSSFTKEQAKALKKAISHFSRTESQIHAKKAKARHR